MAEFSELIPDASTMRMKQTEGGIEITFDNEPNKRLCSSCQLCCRLLPVPDLPKPAATRCQHQRYGKGCSIYPSRPESCRLFSCRWLIDADAHWLRRPDRSHYVIDSTMDQISILDNASGERVSIDVVQIWVDPAYPDAHRDPGLRAYLDRLAEQYGVAALVRFNSSDALAIFPPCMSRDGEWHEERSGGREPT